KTLGIASNTRGMVQAATTWTMGLPDYEVKVDPQRAQELGLSPEEISQQAYYALRGGLTNEFYRLPNLKQTTIMVRYDEEDPQLASRLDKRDAGRYDPDDGLIPPASLRAGARSHLHVSGPRRPVPGLPAAAADDRQPAAGAGRRLLRALAGAPGVLHGLDHGG